MSDQRNIVIVGASAAGLRCAARLARLQPGWRIRVVEARADFSWGACGLPYVLSGDIADLQELHRTADGATRDETFFARVKGIEVLAGTRATDVDVDARTLTVQDADGERTLDWDELVLATGARPRPLPGQPDHPRVAFVHAAEDVVELHGRLATGKIGSVAIVGAGFLGLELCEAFGALWGAEVTLIETAPAPLPGLLDPATAGVVTAALRGEDVRVLCGEPVESIEADDDGTRVKVGGETIEADAVVVAIGVAPAIELAEAAGVALGPTGAIAVDDRFATSVPGIRAIGDAAEVSHAVSGRPAYLPLGSLANRQGRTLANILSGRDDAFPPVTGAGALKCFDCNVAAAGLTRRAARAMGLAADAVWISGHDKADYFPEDKDIFLQLTWCPDDGRVLGVQVVGEGECAKRADVAAQLLARGGRLSDFIHIEHAYSPPYAPALEPLAVAAMVAENVADGPAPGDPLAERDGRPVLDVRHDDERAERPFADAVGLALEDLRDRLGELDGGPWLVACERGTRSAEAVRILKTAGMDAEYVGGGIHWVNQIGETAE